MRFLRENQDLWDTRKSSDIMKAVREKEWLAEKVKVQRSEGKVARKIPEHLKTAFAKFVIDVATSAAEQIRAARREPEWLLQKRELDQAKYLVRRWTPEEDEKLRQLLKNPELRYREIGQLLDRSKEAVAHRIGRIDVWGKSNDREVARQ